jgi:leucyl-tRNA synthetase
VCSTSSIKGVKRFIDRVANLKSKIGTPCTNTNIIHQTIKKVSEDVENFKFNTCVSQFMIALNEFEEKGISQEEYDMFMTVLFPFAPTIAHEYAKVSWPKWDENKLNSDTVKLALQINGKLRDTFEVALNASEDEVKELVKSTEGYKKYITEAGVEVKKVIVVPNKIVNIVI